MSYSRWLLMHLNRPVDAMRSIYAALKPGGLIVCEEADMSVIYAEPPSGYHEYVELAFAVGATLGVDYAGACERRRSSTGAGGACVTLPELVWLPLEAGFPSARIAHREPWAQLLVAQS